jgi:hypothetical protein
MLKSLYGEMIAEGEVLALSLMEKFVRTKGRI